jgi:metal-responsive CopG/Arc/MetJ family transcriptional regulator
MGRKRSPDAKQSQKVILQFPASLLKRADEIKSSLGVTRSSFIRTCVEEKIRKHEMELLHEELRRAYREMEERRLANYHEFMGGGAHEHQEQSQAQESQGQEPAEKIP